MFDVDVDRRVGRQRERERGRREECGERLKELFWVLPTGHSCCYPIQLFTPAVNFNDFCVVVVLAHTPRPGNTPAPVSPAAAAVCCRCAALCCFFIGFASEASSGELASRCPDSYLSSYSFSSWASAHLACVCVCVCVCCACHLAKL